MRRLRDKNRGSRRPIKMLCVLLLGVFLSACATSGPTQINDPLESANRAVFGFNDKVDRYAIKPLATGYKRVTPPIVRVGVNNFFGNLADVSTAANGVLQGKLKQGLSDTARVAINTVIGLGGFIDVASQLDFEKHYEDFGQTLGVWGVAEGPFIVLPFLGPQTLRSTTGFLANSQIEPLNTLEVHRDTRSGLVAVNVLNARANLLAASSMMDSGALDRYRYVRDRYLGWRRKQVYDRHIDNNSDDDQEEVDELEKLDMLDELDELEELDELLD